MVKFCSKKYRSLLEFWYNLVGIDLTDEMFQKFGFDSEEERDIYKCSALENCYDEVICFSLSSRSDDCFKIDDQMVSLLDWAFMNLQTEGEILQYIDSCMLIIRTCLNLNLVDNPAATDNGEDTDNCEDNIDYIKYFSDVSVIINKVLIYLKGNKFDIINKLADCISKRDFDTIEDMDLDPIFKYFILIGMLAGKVEKYTRNTQVDVLESIYTNAKQSIKKMTPEEEVVHVQMIEKWKERIRYGKRLSYEKCVELAIKAYIAKHDKNGIFVKHAAFDIVVDYIKKLLLKNYNPDLSKIVVSDDEISYSESTNSDNCLFINTLSFKVDESGSLIATISNGGSNLHKPCDSGSEAEQLAQTGLLSVHISTYDSDGIEVLQEVSYAPLDMTRPASELIPLNIENYHNCTRTVIERRGLDYVHLTQYYNSVNFMETDAVLDPLSVKKHGFRRMFSYLIPVEAEFYKYVNMPDDYYTKGLAIDGEEMGQKILRNYGNIYGGRTIKYTRKNNN